MAAIIETRDGKAGVEIPDRFGELRFYALRRRREKGLWVYTFLRDADRRGEHTWEVTVFPKGPRCTCPDDRWRNRASRKHDGPCKHCAATLDLHALFAAMESAA